MSILADHEIINICDVWKEGSMITPFYPTQRTSHGEEPVISYGLSSYGYDIRIADEFNVARGWKGDERFLDPKDPRDDNFINVTTDILTLPPNTFALGRSVERFKIPRDILGICVGKSTYARNGVIVNVTPLEPEWEGFLTIEISNTSPHNALIYANEGIAQLIFHRASSACLTSYADKKGKYQGQKGIEKGKV